MKVRDAIRLIEDDGWFIVATRGGRRQYKHPTKPGRVTIAGKPSDDFGAGHAKQYYEAGWAQGAAVMRYAIVIEKADGNYSAYVPDLAGCVATGATVGEVDERNPRGDPLSYRRVEARRTAITAADQHRELRGGVGRVSEA